MDTLDVVYPTYLRNVESVPVRSRERTAGFLRQTRSRPRVSSRIFVRKLPLQARIGVYEWEKAAPQPIVVDVECALPDTVASHTDCIGDTVDYGVIVERLRSLALERHCDLVEALAERMAEMIQFEFGVPWLMLTLTKTAPIPGAEVGITIERGEWD